MTILYFAILIICFFLPSLILKLPLKKLRPCPPGEALLKTVKECEREVRRGNLACNSYKSKIKYKFFTELLDVCLSLSFQFGISLKKPLALLKKNIRDEIHFDGLVAKENSSSIFQFFVMSVVTLSFSFFIDIAAEILLLVILLQVFGVATYYTLQRYLKHRALVGHENCFKNCFLLELIGDVPIGVDELKQLTWEMPQNSRFEWFREYYHNIFSTYLNVGEVPYDEISALYEELVYERNQALRQCLTHLNGLKLMVGAVFFLSAYFIQIASLAVSQFD